VSYGSGLLQGTLPVLGIYLVLPGISLTLLGEGNYTRIVTHGHAGYTHGCRITLPYCLSLSLCVEQAEQDGA